MPGFAKLHSNVKQRNTRNYTTRWGGILGKTRLPLADCLYSNYQIPPNTIKVGTDVITGDRLLRAQGLRFPEVGILE